MNTIVQKMMIDDARQALSAVSVLADVSREIIHASDSELIDIPESAPLIQKLSCSRTTCGILDAIELASMHALTSLERFEDASKP